jgi:anti-sigma-K factor RskA
MPAQIVIIEKYDGKLGKMSAQSIHVTDIAGSTLALWPVPSIANCRSIILYR